MEKLSKQQEKYKKYHEQMDSVFKELCKEFDLPMVSIQAIVESPYKFIFSKMRETKFYNFSIPSLGKLHIPNGVKERLIKDWPVMQEAIKRKHERKAAYYEERRRLQREQVSRDLQRLEEPDFSESSSGGDGKEQT